jgi:hypothetical protein
MTGQRLGIHRLAWQARAEIHITYYSSSTGFYIHGKVVEADYGTGHARMFVGSENFSPWPPGRGAGVAHPDGRAPILRISHAGPTCAEDPAFMETSGDYDRPNPPQRPDAPR